ncbi:MAG: hydrogenase expression/formation C-terminal domain-containing protein [Pseudomonadota bacterium]
MQHPGTPGCDPQHAAAVTGNVIPLLHEIRHALSALLEEGRETTIDLRSLPLGPGEEDEIEQLLGCGEVRVELSALGPSEIVETRYPGVWIVTHHNTDGAVIGRFIEICLVPQLVAAQTADIHAGLAELNARLN